MQVVIVLGSERVDGLVRSRSILDLHVTCETIASELTYSITAKLGVRPHIANELRDALELAKKLDDDVVLIDAHVYHLDYSSALDAVLQRLVETGEPVILASRPLLERGVRLAVKGGSVEGVGGDEAFAGMLVLPKRMLSRITASSWRELLELITPAPVARPHAQWVRLEEHFDVLVAQMLKLDELRGVHVEPGAHVAPTAVLEGPVLVEAGARIDHYAVLKGPVMVCRGSFIGIHAVVRRYTLVAPEARIGSQSETYVASLQRRSTISSKVYITGSVVGEAARIEPFVVTRVVYGREAAEKLRFVAPPPSELRVGAVLEAGTSVTAHKRLEPLTIIEQNSKV